MTPEVVFRPRRGRIMALTVAGVALVIFGLVAGLMPGLSPGDRVAIFGLGVVMALLMWRYASLRCDVLEDGLRVRNLILTTRVRWHEVEDFVFPEGDAWPKLLLADHDDLAIMAIQRSDGPFGQEQAHQLAEVITAHRS